MLNIPLEFTDDEVIRLKKTAKVNGMSEAEFKDLLKTICYDKIDKEVMAMEVSEAKNNAIDNIQKTRVPIGQR
jgi:hypothetical protein